MKTALVTGAGGFIAGHHIKKLKAEGYSVRGVDLKLPEFGKTEADEFLLLDLRQQVDCDLALSTAGHPFDQVYHLAADMAGMGFIDSAECEIMRNSDLININMIHASAHAKVGRYFFSSSVCIYRDMAIGEPELLES